MFRSHVGGVVPRDQILDLVLFVTVDDGGERGCQPGLGIDAVHFAGLDQRCDYGPIFGTGVMTCEEGILAVQGDGADRALDGVAVHLDAAVGHEAAETVAVFGDIGQRFTQGGFGGCAGAMVA